jgi:thiol:disulfide interchange protein DsbD
MTATYRPARFFLSLAAATLVLAAGRTDADSPARVEATPATAKLIDFTVSLQAEPADPFAPANGAGAKTDSFRRGEVFTLLIHGTPKPGYHTYPITQRADDEAQGEGQLTKLTFDKVAGLRPLGPVREDKPDWEAVAGVGATLVFDRPFTWAQDFVVLPDAAPGPRELAFSLKLLVCENKGSCTPGEHRFRVPLTVSDAPTATLPPEVQKRLDEPTPPVKVVPVPEDVRAQLAKGPGPQPSAPGGGTVTEGDTSLWGLLLATMGAAVAMLFTPCVFPMIPITVSFFLKQAEKEHHSPLTTAVVYAGTIIVVLALAVLVLGQLIVTLANNPWLNLGLGLMLVVFALSLFGMYELELPHALAQFTSAREGRGGYLGAVFMALTFTITSFTCTGPFLGPLLVAAKELQLSLPRLVLAAFVYSGTFAAPFFVLALFPSLVKKLPRSGGWLNAVKVVMGFLELAAGLKFLANTDIGWNPGNPRLFNYETVFCAWIVLSVACALYLLGLYRLPHDTPVEHLGAARMLLATLFLGLAVYMMPALWRKTPQGIVGEWLVAFAPLDTGREAFLGNAGDGGGKEKGHETFLDYDKAWEQAVKEKKDLFIDFTGVNCTNCRANENNVFPLPRVRQEMQKFVVVQLYNDSVPRPGLSGAEAEAEAARNLGCQRDTFHDVSTPMYVILRPDPTGPPVTEDGKLRGQVLARPFKGYIADPDAFVEFLKSAQRR